MSKILGKEFTVVLAILIILTSGLFVHSFYSSATGHMPTRGRNNKGNRYTAGSYASPNIPKNTVYITDNITVPVGQAYSLTNENIVIESLSLNSIQINSSGTLNIINSSLAISGASYSVVKDFFIKSGNGSSLNILNSTLMFSGAVFLNGTTATISGSSLNSTSQVYPNPELDALRLQTDNTTLRVLNSTISGLYRQNSSVEYSDAGLYCYEPGFSQNAVVPMAVSSHVENRSMINKVEINVTYVGNSTENINSLWVYYNNTVIDQLPLPYTVNQTSRQANFTVEIPGVEHSLNWMENSSNFRIVAHINFPDAIALSNVTETMMSNDTVNLYGLPYYSYVFSRSTVLFYNTGIGLNEKPELLSTGQANPGRLFLTATNSSVLMGDTHMSENSTYSSPFFNIGNSSIFLFRAVQVAMFSHGIQVTNGSYAITPAYGPGEVSNSSRAAFGNMLNRTGSSWFLGQNAVLYETSSNGMSWNYTNEFMVSSGTGNTSFSVPPFPELFSGAQPLLFNINVPFASFGIAGVNVSANGSGEISVQLAGNLSGLRSLTASWNIYQGNQSLYQGTESVPNTSATGNIVLPFATSPAIQPGQYTVFVHFSSRYTSALNKSGWANSSFYVKQVPAGGYNVTIREQGLSRGMIWGISIHGVDSYSNSTSILITLDNGTKASLIIPQGMQSNSSTINLNSQSLNYTVQFWATEYTVSFFNRNIPANSSWSLVIDGHIYYAHGQNISLTLQPGTYNYLVSDPQGYSLSANEGIVNLSNSSRTVSLSSARIVPISSRVTQILEMPQAYIPLTILAVLVITMIGWRSSHTWYACENCGSTRKRKRDRCPYCEK